MSISTRPATAPTTNKGGSKSTSLDESRTTVQRQFVQMALNMGWQLGVVVLVPVIAGVQLDKALNTKYVCTFIGLAVAFIGSGFVMWRAMQQANRMPVPKLTAAQKAAVKKAYDEDDE